MVAPKFCRDATTNEPLEEFDLVHREALRDVSGLDLSQRILVVDAERDLMGEDGGDALAEMMNDPRPRRSRALRARMTQRNPARPEPAEARREEGDILPKVPTRYLGDGVFERGQFFDNMRALVELGIRNWPEISKAQIRRSLQRIDRGKPFDQIVLKKRSALFTKAEEQEITRALKMRDLPDLSSIIESRSEGPLPASGLMKVLDGFGLDGTVPSAREDQRCLATDAANARRSRHRDLGDQSGEPDAIVGDLPDVPPVKKKKKSKKKRSPKEKDASDAEGVPQLRDEADDNLFPERGLDTISGQGTGVVPQGTPTGQEGIPLVTPPKKKRKKKKTKADPEAEAQTLKEVDSADDRLGASEPRAPLPAHDLAFRALILTSFVRGERCCFVSRLFLFRHIIFDADECGHPGHEIRCRAQGIVREPWEGSGGGGPGKGACRVAALETLSMNAEDIAGRLKAQGLGRSKRDGATSEKAEVAEEHAGRLLHREIPMSGGPSLHSSEHSLGGRSGGTVGNRSVGQDVAEESGKGSISVASDSMEEEEEEEVSGFNSDDGRDPLESDKARPTSEDVELQVSTIGVSHPSPEQKGTKDADPAAPTE
ncbi:hypothetical protein Bca52824_022938 [Brassica carinata]|uniref:Uncharacterized protein n=1 Tax=Brassica carinata TaxID=52824 RepID=A0A8X7VHI1_BRACI|nr:hypothetical protein Bca52824_022938 [Brassica carinata]